MRLYVNGIGMLGPGLSGWRDNQAILAGASPYRDTTRPDPTASILPPNERRRSSDIVRWAVHVAQEAIEQAQVNPRDVATVFASSCGETDVLDRLCTALATPQRVISPTLFHHSVHNAAAGYWGIATGSQQSSTALSCYDSSFCAALLDAAAYVHVEGGPVLLVAYDLPSPPPLYAARPLREGFAAAFVLAGSSGQQSLVQLDLSLSDDLSLDVTSMEEAGLETLRSGNPAARSLPLLAAIAGHRATPLCLEYLEDQRLSIRVTPCRS